MGSTPGSSASSSSSSSPAPKILLAKPGLVGAGPSAGKFIRGGTAGVPGGGGGDDDSASLRSRLPPVGSLNLLSDSWEFHIDRFLPFLTDNTEFTVVGVIGTPGVGKSTIMNEIYGFDSSSPGMLPPFAIQSEEIKVNARHCTSGVEPRITSERIILLDTQPVFSPSILAEMTRPDGSSSVSVLNGENLSSELAHELMGIQLGVLLASVCHILLVVSEGVHDTAMWHLMSTIDLLKHGIPDPSSMFTSHSQSSEKENKDMLQEFTEEYMATTVFIHTRLRHSDLSPRLSEQMSKTLLRYFISSSFLQERRGSTMKQPFPPPDSENSTGQEFGCKSPNLFLLPTKSKDSSAKPHYESYDVMLWKLRDQVLSMKRPTFSRTISERDWLKNTAKIWDLVKNSSIIAEYSKMLHSSGLFRR